jgi:hypothetical protein
MTTATALRQRLGLTAAPKTRFHVGDTGLNQQQARLVAQLAERGTSAVLKFCLSNLQPPLGAHKPLTETSLQISMRRFVAIAWLLHSEMLVGNDGKPLTLDQLGKIPQLDCTKCALSLLAKRFADQFNFHARIQKKKGSKPNYAAAAKTGWDKRRARQKAAARK